MEIRMKVYSHVCCSVGMDLGTMMLKARHQQAKMTTV